MKYFFDVPLLDEETKAAVLESRYGLDKPRHELFVIVATDQRLGDRCREETRGRIVVEDRAGFADESDDHVSSGWRSAGARGGHPAQNDREAKGDRGARGDQRGVEVGLITVSTCSTSKRPPTGSRTRSTAAPARSAGCRRSQRK